MSDLKTQVANGRAFLIRHGQTFGNKHCYVGWDDLPLDPLGIEQAREIARYLRAYPLDSIYSSPLIRAQATAEPLARQLGLDILLRPELKEIHYGEHQGRLKSELALKLRKTNLYQRLPGGECLLDVYNRLLNFGSWLRSEVQSGRQVAVVGHFWSLRLLAGILKGSDFVTIVQDRTYKPANGSIHTVHPTESLAKVSNVE